jgi:thioredoxin-dependent peroxiredoxin
LRAIHGPGAVPGCGVTGHAMQCAIRRLSAVQVSPTNKETDMLKMNQIAPEFSSPNQRNQFVSLSSFKGKKHVVLYFYPKDDTPGCTIEANQFTALASAFAALDAVVIGVSKDNCASHQAFIDKYGLKLDLLADTTGELCERYGVWQEKEKNGEKKKGIVRSTFLIDKAGILQHAQYGVSAEGHAQDMLDKVRQL